VVGLTFLVARSPRLLLPATITCAAGIALTGAWCAAVLRWMPPFNDLRPGALLLGVIPSLLCAIGLIWAFARRAHSKRQLPGGIDGPASLSH